MTQERSILRRVLLPAFVLAAAGALGACVVAPYPGYDGGYRGGNVGYYPGHGGYQRGPGDDERR